MAFQKVEKGQLKFAGFEEGETDSVDDLGLAFVNTFKTFGLQVILFPVGMFVSYFICKKIALHEIYWAVDGLEINARNAFVWTENKTAVATEREKLFTITFKVDGKTVKNGYTAA